MFLAFQDETGGEILADSLPRSFFTPEEGVKQMKRIDEQGHQGFDGSGKVGYELNDLINAKGPELKQLPDDRYQFPDNQNYYDWAKVFKFLAPHYVPSHRDALNAVAAVIVPAD